MTPRKVFLSAEWNYLAMLNYRVPQEVLIPHLPKGTELDLLHGHAMMSVVGFLFNDTRVFGLKWPFHTHFEEVNLRFYIKRFDGNEWKRGVAFISEIVPKPVIASIARTLYNEPYHYKPMKHEIQNNDDEINVSYRWKNNDLWNKIELIAQAQQVEIGEDSDEEFILEHYWGYNQLNKTTTIEYQVEHPRWKVFPVKQASLVCNSYAEPFASLIKKPFDSAFLARGSQVIVRKPRFIPIS